MSRFPGAFCVRRSLRAITSAIVTLCAVSVVLPSGSAYGQTRRAFIVGIDNYRPATAAEKEEARRQGTLGALRSDLAWQSLDGAVNDAVSMRDVLLHRFGFTKENIHLLVNEKAKRQAILDGMRHFFIEEARDGDTLFFYYAGHGSQVRNSLSYKSDKLDETIVPWDANVGVWDIRDKEIARLLNEVLDKHKVVLTAIFDSCHSGSIARGLAAYDSKDQPKTRSIPGDLRDAKDDYHATPPEDRGALIISSAQFNESAREAVEEHDGVSISHGAFTLALLQTLNRTPPDITARDVFRIARLTMHSSWSPQEPVLAGNNERAAKGLFGDFASVSPLPKVVVQAVTSAGKIVLDGGYSIGLERNAELKDPIKLIRLRIVSVSGLSSSVAEPIGKDINPASIKTGDVFEIDRWAFPPGAVLSVSLPPGLPLQELQQAREILSRLQEKNGVTWVRDTTETIPTHLIHWTGNAWQLQTPDKTLDLGSRLDEESLWAQVQACGPSNKLIFVDLPPPLELINTLHLGQNSENNAIDTAQAPGKDKYWLVGRVHQQALEYAWVQPKAGQDGAGSGDSPLPERTDWIKLEDANPGKTAATLTSQLQAIARIQSWMTLPSPPEEKQFPYQLMLRETESGKWITGSDLQPVAGTISETSSRIATPRVRGGEELQIILKADVNKLKGYQEPRKVYVFGIDSFGMCRLFFPQGADDQRNRMPEKDATGTYPTEVPVATIRVDEPWGVDTYIMLTSDTPLTDLTVFNCEPVRTRGSNFGNPLANLLQRTRSLARGDRDDITPADWSIQRLPVLSDAPRQQ